MLSDNKCEVCNPRQYLNDDLNDTNSCSNCPDNCLNCKNGLECDECENGHFVTDKKDCSPCSDKNCKKCLSATDCETPKDGWVKDDKGQLEKKDSCSMDSKIENCNE